MSGHSMFRPLVLAPLLAMAACAGQPVPETTRVLPAPAVRRAQLPEEYCLRSGTRLPLAEGRCAPTSGRVVTREDLDSTGEIGAGEALKRLDPL